jgi:hypothetical protein
MKSLYIALFISVIVLMCGCSKTAPVGPWSGTYVNVLGVTDSFSSVSVIYNSNNTANVVCKLYQFGYVYTAFTLQNVALTGTTASFNQKQHIIEATDLGLYDIQGNMSLTSNQITFNAVATNLTSYNPNDTKHFQFSGAVSN